ncbi:MAG: flippase-like domain-containing protein [Chloroflexi bacterium]|nr:flippase-like domain-containing protein [Chloroflexota bacterium]
MNLRRLIGYLLSFIVTIFFLALALANVRIEQLQAAFAAADYRFAFFAAGATFAAYIFRAARWRQLLAPSQKISIARLFPVLIVGFALNNLLPGRPGEFLRAHALGKRENLSRMLGFGTVVLERVVDGLTLLAFLLIAYFAFSPLHLFLPELAEWIGLIAFILFSLALAAIIFLLKREQLALHLFHRLTQFLPRRFVARVEQMIGSFTLGMHSLHSAREVAMIALLSLAVWVCEFISYFAMLTAFHTLAAFSLRPVAAAMTMVLINLGIMIPAAPGGLGPYEAAGIFALSAFTVNANAAASFALAMHATQYLLITSLGFIFIWREGVSLVEMSTVDS